MMFRLFSILMTGLFVFAAVVQYNDPDPWLWIGVYLSVALISAAALPGWNIRIFSGLLCVALFSGVVILSDRFSDTSLQAFTSVGMDSIVEEEVRELWGLLIALLWTLTLFVKSIIKRD